MISAQGRDQSIMIIFADVISIRFLSAPSSVAPCLSLPSLIAFQTKEALGSHSFSWLLSTRSVAVSLVGPKGQAKCSECTLLSVFWGPFWLGSSRKHGEGFFRWVHLSCSHESHHKVSLQGIIIMKVIARSHRCKESLQGVMRVIASCKEPSAWSQVQVASARS